MHNHAYNWVGIMDAHHLKCEMCGYISPNLMLYVSHLRLIHVYDESFHVVCGIGNCDKEYTAFAAYSSHIYRYHRVALGLHRGACEEMILNHEAESDGDVFNSVDVEIPVFQNDNSDVCKNDNSDECTEWASLSLPTRAAKFLLQLREGYRVSQVALLNILHTCNEMCVQAGNGIKQEIKDRLIKANIDTNIIDDIVVAHPFEKVNSIYLLEKYCVDHFNCLVSFSGHLPS